MFRPYKTIFRQLFNNWNCRTAPVRKGESVNGLCCVRDENSEQLIYQCKRMLKYNIILLLLFLISYLLLVLLFLLPPLFLCIFLSYFLPFLRFLYYSISFCSPFSLIHSFLLMFFLAHLFLSFLHVFFLFFYSPVPFFPLLFTVQTRPIKLCVHSLKRTD
jgi:hypothetical protein